MARPTKSVNLMSKHLTKEEIDLRSKKEEQLKGKSDNIVPPKYLSRTQKNIFKNIVLELKESNILSNLDIYLLSTCSISIDRLINIETQINDTPSLIRDNDLMRAKDKYTKDFYRCCNELSLSPQSRAKISNMNVQAKQKEEDPLFRVLKGGMSDKKSL